jgi:DNA-binding beta-propeller fold protein YncE/cytochrome c peroxidase
MPWWLLVLAPCLPALDLTVRPVAPVPVASAAQFTVQVPPGTEVSWDFADGTVLPFGPATTVEHRYDAVGRYGVLVRVRHGGEAASKTVVQVIHHPRVPGQAAWSSPIAVDPARDAVWVVGPDQDTLTCLDGATRTVRLVVPTGRHPRSVAVGPEGQVWVANEDDDTLTLHQAGDGARLATVAFAYGARPCAVAFGDGRLYVTLAGSGRLAVVDPQLRRITAEGEVGREPRGVAVSADGRRVLVTCFFSAAAGGRVVEVDPRTATVRSEALLEPDPGEDTTSSGRGLPNALGAPALSPDGRLALIPATKANIARGLRRDGQPLTPENTVRTILARLDLGTWQEDLAARLDLDNRAMASAVAFSPVGDLAFVACQGNDLVEVVDLVGNLRQGLLRGVGAAPQGLVLDDRGQLWVQGFLSRTVTVLDVAGILAGTTNEARVLATLATGGPEPLPPAVLRGKRLFYLAEDPALSFDGYLSCASCHQDGRHDGLTWDFTDRGEGLRNTIALVGRRGTGHGPLHWSANFDEVQDFEHDIRTAFGGTGLMADADFHRDGRDRPLGTPKAGISPDLDALGAYLASLNRVGRSPYRTAAGALTPAGAAGRALFQRLGCATCHGGPDFTDSALGRRHAVGTITAASGTRLGGQPLDGLDTPTLRGLWDTAPYLHDGSAATLHEVLTTRNAEDRHGVTSGLTAQERDQLVAYLLQIDDTEPALPPVPPEAR